MPSNGKKTWELSPNRVWLFFGKPGTGKSTTARLVVNRLLAQDPASIALIHDPHPTSDRHRGYGARKIYTSPEAFRQAEQIQRVNVFQGAFDPCELAPLALELGRLRPVILVYDELDLVIGNGGMFRDGGQGGPLHEVANYGRHRRVSLVGTARRAPTVGPMLQSSAAGLFVLRLDSPADMNWCKSVIDPETADQIKKLPPFSGIFRDEHGETHRFQVNQTSLRFQ